MLKNLAVTFFQFFSWTRFKLFNDKKINENQENTDYSNLLRHLDSNSPEQAKTDVNLIPNKKERVKETVVAVILKYVE